MNDELPPRSVDRMPTLTEVVELQLPSGTQELIAEPLHDAVPVPAEARALPASALPVDTQGLVNEVLAELQPRIDLVFESRLREALAPALARAADGLIREARSELGGALHDVVEDAVKRALQRRGGRW